MTDHPTPDRAATTPHEPDDPDMAFTDVPLVSFLLDKPLRKGESITIGKDGVEIHRRSWWRRWLGV